MPRVPISHPLALERLRAAGANAGPVDVLAAAIAIATHVHPLLVPQKIQDNLDRLARDTRHIISHGNPVPAALQHVLFLRHGFTGNVRRYGDPLNSYIDSVLERRTGLPILLALVYVETARRCGQAAHGIGLPGHFLAALDGAGDPPARRYVDVFNGGKEMSPEACRRLVQSHGAPWQEELLAPVDGRRWALRILANLHNTYAAMGDTANTAAVLEQTLLLDAAHTTAGTELQGLYERLDKHIARNN